MPLSGGSVLASIGLAVLLIGTFVAGQVSGVNLAKLARGEGAKDDDSKA